MKKEEQIELIKPFMYCYMGSGMLTNDYDEGVAVMMAKNALEALEKANQLQNKWISVDIEPEFGGEYNVVYDLEDGDSELVVTTLMYCKIEKLWRDERGANYLVNTVKLWQPLPDKPILTTED